MKRILVFDQDQDRADACQAAFGTRAHVHVRSGVLAPPPGPWDLVLLHKTERADFDDLNIERRECLLYDGSGVREGILRPISAQGLNTHEAARIVSVLESFPEDEWGSRLKDIWGGVPEAVLLAALTLQVGGELPDELREIADDEYRARRSAGDVEDDVNDINRLTVFKSLINAERKWTRS
jgi:hypothetical protein